MLVSFNVANAQVTSSGMTGLVSDPNGEPVIGATVVATHEPSGTTYSGLSNIDGRFNFQGMRNGGPYSVEFSYIGYKTTIINEISLQLGNVSSINIKMEEDTQLIGEVVVVSHGSKLTGVKTGNSTNISSVQMESLPSTDRSISDFTRLSPYSGADGSFGSMDTRMNTFTVDGANLNNNFGLSSGALPGGGNPISIDAIEEIQVNIAPFDVRQTNFIGAGISAITKSGTNEVSGSAYSYFTNENLRGNSVNGTDLGERPIEKSTVYGFTLGAPIVKDKLFIFVNGEYTDQPKPLFNWKTSEDGMGDASNYISSVTQEDLTNFKDYLMSEYGYDGGSTTDYVGGTTNYKALVRIDWNINEKNKLALRYNYTNNTYAASPSSSMPGTSSESGTVSVNSMPLSYNGYYMSNLVNSFTAELNSVISDDVSNQFLATYTSIKDIRSSDSEAFPFVAIWEDGDSFMSAGYELFTYNNALLNDTFTITDNVSINLGSHAITAGAAYEYQFVANSFMPYALGYYRYDSYDAFVNGDAPILYAQTYGYEDDSPSADLAFGQASAYLQDIYSPLENLKITMGLRVDVPMYYNELEENTAVTAATFADGEKVQTYKWPTSTPLFSPRVGWNWDVFSDHKLQIRGGTGIFTGRVPLIFFTNMPNNSGMLQNSSVTITDPDLLQYLSGGIKSAEEVREIAELSEVFPTSPSTSLPGTIASVSEDFKLPQVWKSSIAADIELPLSFPASLTLETMYTKNINAAVMHNANTISTDDASVTTFDGPDNRYYFPDDSKVYDEVSGAYVLTNTSEGYSYSFNATVNARPLPNMQVMFGYAHTQSYELSGNPGSQPSELLNNIPTVNGVNNLELQSSRFLTPNKLVGSLSYRLNYGMCSTIFGLYYSGYNSGNGSYLFTNDMNNDGVNMDLIYIPSSKDELSFVDKNGFTAEEQADAFWNFINQDDYLSEHKGEYAEGYAVRLPWVNNFDLRIAQEFKLRTAKKTHTLQLSVDVSNIGNLLNDAWGATQSLRNSGKILTFEGVDENNVPTYSMYSYYEDGELVLPTDSFMYYNSSSQCWSVQFGVKYTF